MVGAALQEKFEFLMRQLKADNTREITLRHVVQKPVEVEPPKVTAGRA